VELRGEELSRYLNSQFVGLWKCLYDHWLANKAYFSDIAVKNIYQSFTHKMAAKPAGIENTSLSHYVKITPSYYVRTMSARWAHGVCCSWIGSHTWLRALSNGGIADDWVTLTTPNYSIFCIFTAFEHEANGDACRLGDNSLLTPEIWVNLHPGHMRQREMIRWHYMAAWLMTIAGNLGKIDFDFDKSAKSYSSADQ